MYKVMIVDDEEPVLKSYIYMIESGTDSFEVCAAARSGFEAISMAHSTNPDIVFMDIGLPGIDGLDTIKELQRTYPGMLFIFSTAYERFDIAKKAIPLGVFEYLVKPISKKRFLKTLEEAKHHLDEKKELNESRLANAKISADSKTWEEKNFLLMISWKGLSKTEWEQYRCFFSIDSDRAAIFLIRVHGVDEETRKSILKSICMQVSYTYRILSTEYLGKLLLFIPGDTPQESLRNCLNSVVNSNLSSGATAQMGLGSSHSFDSFYLSCQEAFQEFNEQEGEDITNHEDWEARNELRRAISTADSFESVQPLFSRYCEQVFSSSPFQVAKARMVEFFILLLDDFYRSLGKDAERHLLFDPAGEITPLASRSEWDAWSGRALRILVEAENLYLKKQSPSVLNRAMYYVRGNYDKQLQLSDVADFCRISTGYLSRLFSEHLGLSFVDYLTSVRLKVAEELLLENRHTIKEIAYCVGYHDPNYFSRIFRKQKGITPTSYLQEHSYDKKT